MKFLSHIPFWIRSKYFISFAAFMAILLFLDKNDLFTTLARNRELLDLQKSKAYYTKAIMAEQTELDQLKTNPSTLEKYAREKYLMKRDNEDLYIISEKPATSKN